MITKVMVFLLIMGIGLPQVIALPPDELTTATVPDDLVVTSPDGAFTGTVPDDLGITSSADCCKITSVKWTSLLTRMDNLESQLVLTRQELKEAKEEIAKMK